jgi:hypothetical protein
MTSRMNVLFASRQCCPKKQHDTHTHHGVPRLVQLEGQLDLIEGQGTVGKPADDINGFNPGGGAPKSRTADVRHVYYAEAGSH